MTGYGKIILLCGALVAGAVPAGGQPIGSGGPATVQPDEDEGLQVAAGVSQVHSLAHQGQADVTLFGLVGGDPAMNGEYVMLAFHGAPADGAKVFRIGDVLEFHILSDAPGRLLLQVRENIMGRNGNIGVQNRRVLVTWTPGRDGAAPGSVTVRTAPAAAPARRR
jgi:hypothetical protein